TQITNLDAFASFPSFSPDGSRLSFYVYQKGSLELWTVNKDGSKAVQMTQGLASENKSQCTFACHMASWSPDGCRRRSHARLPHALGRWLRPGESLGRRSDRPQPLPDVHA